MDIQPHASVRDQGRTTEKANLTEPMAFPTTVKLEKTDFVNNPDKMLFWARLQIVFLGILLGLLVFFWARDLYGFYGGVLALTFFCFDPNFIAHSGLVTTDVGITLFMFGAVYFLWRTCIRFQIPDVCLMLLFFACAFGTKFSAVLLIPMFVLIGLWWSFSRNEWLFSREQPISSRTSKVATFCGLLATALLTGYVLLWALYDFRYSAAADPAKTAKEERVVLPKKYLVNRESGHFPIDEVVARGAAMTEILKQQPDGPRYEYEIIGAMRTAPIGLVGKSLLLARDYHLLPESYIYGFSYAQMKSLIRSSYALGNCSNHGFWYYFPLAFLLKTPLVTLIAITASIFFAIRRKDSWDSRLMFLLIPVGVYLAFAISSNLNIGHRHLLPIYPFLFVLCGSLAQVCERFSDKRRLTVAALAFALIAMNSNVVFAPPWKPVVVYPHYLAFFNELAGGPRNGYKSLVDSNLDWGQDLKNLKIWLDEHGIAGPITLCYFGSADPRYYQILHTKIPGGYNFSPPFDDNLDITKISGYVAVSATNFQGGVINPKMKEACEFIRKNGRLVDTVGYSIFIYYLDSANLFRQQR